MEKTDILILGNGFDLQCGLQTSYKCFFEDHKKQNKRIYDLFDRTKNICIQSVSKQHTINNNKASISSFLKAALTNDDIYIILRTNIWFFIFNNIYIKENQNFENWYDIETSISNYLTNIKYFGDFVYCNNFNYSKFDIKQSKIESIALNEFFDFIFNYFKKHSQVLQTNPEEYSMVMRSIDMFNELTKHMQIDKFYEFLKNELLRFEHEFKNYIKTQIDTHGDYSENANDLLYLILEHPINLKTSEKQQTGSTSPIYILNFNYTSPKIIDGYELLGIYRNNIHGHYKDSNNIIIGIDQLDQYNLEKKLEFNINTFMFTKTFRKLDLISYLQTKDLPSKNEIGTIYFYGHSLGKSDYSYFQSIFDYYDIYNNNIKLEFTYTNFNENPLTEMSIKSSISNLLLHYGSSMTNKDHGLNLMHKLLLENRLILREVGKITGNLDSDGNINY